MGSGSHKGAPPERGRAFRSADRDPASFSVCSRSHSFEMDRRSAGSGRGDPGPTTICDAPPPKPTGGQKTGSELNHEKTGSELNYCSPTAWAYQYEIPPKLDSDPNSSYYGFACYRTIALKLPRRHGEPSPASWWLSTRINAAGKASHVIAPHDPCALFGRGPDARRAVYRALFRDALDEAVVNEIRAAIHGGFVLYEA